MIRRRTALFLALAAVSGTARMVRAGADWPTRLIRIIVPYPPGSVTDFLGRLIAERMSPVVGQQIVTENRSGGASSVGTGMVANASADGHTFLIVAVDLAVNQTLLAGRVSYDALRDFAPVSFLAWSPTVLVVHPSVPARTLAELVALARTKPGTIRFASGGIGTGAHMAFELFRQSTGVDMLHVPYRGVAPALVDLLGGNVDAMFVQLPSAQAQVAVSGLRALATPSATRLVALPDVPTVAELGWPAVEVASWFGLVAKSGTPATIVTRVNQIVSTILRDPSITAQLSKQGMTIDVGSPADFERLIRSEVARWGRVIQQAGIKIE